MGDELNQLLTLILAYGYPIIAIIQLLSSIGVPIPMTAVLLVAGASAAAGNLNFVALLFLVTSCGIVGDTFDYFLGRKFGYDAFEKLGKRLPATKMPSETVQRYFLRWSAVTIFFSRWLLTPFSSIVSILAGITHYSFKRFFILDVIGEAISSTILLSLGYLFGADWPYIWDYLHGLPGIFTVSVIGIVLVIVGAKKLSTTKS